MSCVCHGKLGIRVQFVRPEEQCTLCARKHVKSAWSKWNEFTYEEDNRDYVSAQLRDAADHLKYVHRDLALQIRDLAILIEENRDTNYESVGDALNVLRLATRALFYAEHPDARKRGENLKKQKERLCKQ